MGGKKGSRKVTERWNGIHRENVVHLGEDEG